MKPTVVKTAQIHQPLQIHQLLLPMIVTQAVKIQNHLQHLLQGVALLQKKSPILLLNGNYF